MFHPILLLTNSSDLPQTERVREAVIKKRSDFGILLKRGGGFNDQCELSEKLKIIIRRPKIRVGGGGVKHFGNILKFQRFCLMTASLTI